MSRDVSCFLRLCGYIARVSFHAKGKGFFLVDLQKVLMRTEAGAKRDASHGRNGPLQPFQTFEEGDPKPALGARHIDVFVGVELSERAGKLRGFCVGSH